MLKVFIWTLIFNFISYFMMTQYFTDRYLDSVSNTGNVDYNFSTGYKSHICIGIWGAFTLFFIPFLYYVYYTILKQSILYLASFVMLLWFFWDMYPICMTDNGYKLENVFINMFDIIYAGGIWILVSAFTYHTFYKSISKSIPIIALLLVLNIFIMLLFFYRWFIYNRKHTENNWLVKIGDRFNWEKYSDYIILFKSNRNNPDKSSLFHSD